MSRKARQESPTGYYHILMRGNNRNWIFRKNQYKLYFMEMLEEQEKEERIEIVAWCIMDNHVHLILKADLDQLSLAMKKINVKYAMRYNLSEKTIGHVFQDRFKSQVIDSDGYLMQVIRYVHNNPFKARIVGRAEDYKWSSYRKYISSDNKARGQQFKFVLSLLNNSIEEFKNFHMIEDCNEYLEIIEDLEETREEKAQEIIAECCVKHGLLDVEQMRINKRVKNELIAKLISRSGLSYRSIARLLEMPYSTVREVGKSISPTKKQPKRTVPIDSFFEYTSNYFNYS